MSLPKTKEQTNSDKRDSNGYPAVAAFKRAANNKPPKEKFVDKADAARRTQEGFV